MRDVAIIIPVYNEAKVIKDVIENVSKHFSNIICVDDGSSDTSAKIVSNAKATLIKHPFNLGQGAALQTGLEFAMRDKNIKYFATFDADGQHVIEDVMTMLDIIKSKKLDAVLGSRFLGSADNIKRSKKIMLRTAVKVSNLTYGTKLTDAHNGLRVFNRSFGKALNIKVSDMGHASEIIQKLGKGNFKYAEAPVTIKYSDYSIAKGQSIINAINLGFDMVLRKVTKWQ